MCMCVCTLGSQSKDWEFNPTSGKMVFFFLSPLTNTFPPVHPSENGYLSFIAGVQIYWLFSYISKWPRWDFGCPHHKLGELVNTPASY